MLGAPLASGELRFRFACARCGAEADARIGGPRVAAAARLLEGEGLGALAGASAVTRTLRDATHLLQLAPCPACGKRSRRALAAVLAGAAAGVVVAAALVVAAVFVARAGDSSALGVALGLAGVLAGIALVLRALGPLVRARAAVTFDAPRKPSPSA